MIQRPESGPLRLGYRRNSTQDSMRIPLEKTKGISQKTQDMKTAIEVPGGRVVRADGHFKAANRIPHKRDGGVG